MNAPVFKLQAAVQKYDWGKPGATSKVAQFAAAADPTFKLDEKAPYAELWMGTHPSAPARVAEADTTLSEHLKGRPSMIGSPVTAKYPNAKEGAVPFLLKVLAIEKALSIQVHPDKAMAERLHAEQPKIYKDDNHKPEMALALTPFSALCGFLPLSEIATYLSATPELSALVPPIIAERFQQVIRASDTNPARPDARNALRDVFAAVMTADAGSVKEHLKTLVARYRAGAARPQESAVVDLVLTLESQFPDDVGVFCAFLLNHMHLQPGEAIFLGAGEPHAYVSGDIVECMATSDNVIRAGLTPKLRDVPNLVAALTYVAGDPAHHRVQGSPFSDYTTLYDPPIPEFAVLAVRIPANAHATHRGLAGPSVAVVTEGSGILTWGNDEKLDLKLGDVFFVGAGEDVRFTSTDAHFVVYRAFIEVDV